MSGSSPRKDAVLALVSRILKIEADEGCASANRPEWDSLAQMKIIVELEKMFDLEIEDDMLSKLNSVGAIVSYLEAKGR